MEENKTIQTMMGQMNGDTPTSVDIFFVIDSTGSMKPIIDVVKRLSLTFHEDMKPYLKAKGRVIETLRIKVSSFRDFYYDGDQAYVESKWFNLPEEVEDFSAFVNGIEAKGGGDDPETSLEALTLAMRTDWNMDGEKKRHVTVLFTDNEAHKLENHDELVKTSELKGCKVTSYPANMPATLTDFYNEWSKGSLCQDDAVSVEAYKAKRLCIFGPSVYPWCELEQDLENTIRKNIDIDKGGAELTIEDVYSMIAETM